VRWWAASLVAGTGVGIQSVTVPLLVRDRVPPDERAPWIAAALIAQTLPGALLALVGGAVADRVEPPRILLRTYGAAALVSACYVLLAGLDVRAVWPVFPLAAAVGAAGAFTNPARQSLLPQLVDRAQIQNGVILGTMGFMATLQFLGPAVGGLVTDARGLAAAFALEVALLAAAAALFARIETAPPAPSGRSVLGDLADGLRYVAAEPALRALVLLAAIPGLLFVGPFAVTVPIVVPDVLRAGDKWVGLLWGSFGAGVFAGSLLLTLRSLPRRGLAVCLSNLAGGVVLVLYGRSTTRGAAAALLFVWGLSASVFINFVVTLLQERSDPARLGRVMSMYSLVFFLSMPLGYAQAGALTRAFGPQAALVASGVAAAALGLACLAGLRTVRSLR
jgi:predicted MFS family arabinose efflux permease